MDEEKNIEHIYEEDEKAFKTRSEKEDEMYLEALLKEAQGGSISKITSIKTVDESSDEQSEKEVVIEDKPEEASEEKDIEDEAGGKVLRRLPEEEPEKRAEKFVEEAAEDTIEEEVLEEEPEEETLMEFAEGEYSEESESSQWEDPFEEDDSNAIKKYIFGVSLDYVDLIDDMNLDERSAFINDAIYIKLAKEREDAKKYHRNSTLTHIILTIITLIIGAPLLLWVANKSIELTGNNYKRMRGNFETLWTEQAKKNATIRNVQEEMRK